MGKKSLKIAVFSTVSLPIPPYNGYGGTQRGVYDFVKNMSERGHRIHLFGPGDSDVGGLENVTLHSFVPESLWVPENKMSANKKSQESQRHYKKSIEKLVELDETEGLDLINLRFDNVKILKEICSRFGKNRIIYGLHNLKNRERIEAIQRLGVQCVAHCRNHREQYESLPNIKTIIYGIDTEDYPFSNETLSQTNETPTLEILKKLKDKNSDYLINLGAIGKHKGQRTSIRLAKETNHKLILAGMPQDRKSREKGIYFEEEVIPHLDNENIIHFGNADEEQKKELLKFAKGFLFPSGFEDTTWNEPFGRAPVEALACGTPVIAHRKGSMPEVIFDEFNGYLFETMDEALSSIEKIDNIDRKDARRTAEKIFNSKRVAEDYEKLFYKITEK